MKSSKKSSSKEEINLSIFVVDAFTTEAFRGNAAAVCLLERDQEISDDVKQKLAAELNLSETAFVYKLHPADTFQKDRMFGLRWFTPTTEVDLCGHATLASAAVIQRCCDNTSEKLSFRTRFHGDLFASAQKDGSVTLDFPLWNSSPPPPNCDKLVELTVHGFPYTDFQYCAEGKKLLIRLDNKVTRCDFEAMNPLVQKMEEISTEGRIRGIIVTLMGSLQNGCVNEEGQVYDFVSRYFAPWNGIAEDPVTGSAHSFLTPYWSKILQKTDMFARQCSKRGGDLKVRVRPDQRVEVQGNAIIVSQGTISLKLSPSQNSP